MGFSRPFEALGRRGPQEFTGEFLLFWIPGLSPLAPWLRIYAYLHWPALFFYACSCGHCIVRSFLPTDRLFRLCLLALRAARVNNEFGLPTCGSPSDAAAILPRTRREQHPGSELLGQSSTDVFAHSSSSMTLSKVCKTISILSLRRSKPSPEGKNIVLHNRALMPIVGTWPSLRDGRTDR